jgi:hypothetical protein
MLAAVGTLVAVGISIWVAVREAQARRNAEARAETAERERGAAQELADRERAQQAEERRLEQARKVIAWVEHEPANPSSFYFDGIGRRLDYVHVLHLVNNSSAPIFDVTLHIYWRHSNTDEKLQEYAVLPADQHIRVSLPREHQEEGFATTGFVVFRDLAGVRRRRWQNATFNEFDEHGREAGKTYR